MKRTFIFLIAFFYLCLSSGYVIGTHNCEDELVGLNVPEKSCESYNNEGNKRNDEKISDDCSGCKLLKLQIPSIGVRLYYKSLQANFKVPAIFTEIAVSANTSVSHKQILLIDSLSRLNPIPIYLFQGVLLI